MRKGWTGKRLMIDLSLQRAWTEEISTQDLDAGAGGRALNGKYFVEQVPSSVSPSSPEYPIGLAVGPLAGTLAPCSGWTSITSFSILADPPGVVHTSLPGHWGPQLKFAGFDQCIIKGKGERPLYLWIDGDKVRFEDARRLWGKNTVETTVTIQEQKEDRDAEVLCIGPAGEKGIPFANVVNRCSWTGDHVGLGHVFGGKKLKAIAIRGHRPVAIDRPEAFLELCLALKNRMERDRNAVALREEGTLFFLGRSGGGLGINNFGEVSSSGLEEKWKTHYLGGFLYGRESCFACPIHCGRVTQLDKEYFGGVHVEGAWSLGPRIGIHDWESTLRLYRLCQLQGLDPSSVGSLLSWLMDGLDKRRLSEEDLGNIECRWGDAEAAFRVIDRVMEGGGAGEILRQGSVRAARKLAKGLGLVAHAHGMDLPARDPRSSLEYALSLGLFPAEWDYLRSLPPSRSGDKEPAEDVATSEELKILADLTSFCPLVVARLPLVSVSDIAELTRAATGMDCDPSTLLNEVQKTIRIEKTLSAAGSHDQNESEPLSSRFFEEHTAGVSPLSRELFENEITRYHRLKGWTFP